MTHQDQPDRLDRIEATLERVSQQLDNQVVVNAELRQTSTQLQQFVTELTSSVSSLIGIANQHQENFMILVTEIRDIRTEIRDIRIDMQGMQSDIQRILNRIERLENG